MYRYCNIITTGIDCHECAVVQVIGYIVVYAIVYTVVYVVVYVVPQFVLASPLSPISSLFHPYFICISSVFHLYFIICLLRFQLVHLFIQEFLLDIRPQLLIIIN